MPEIIPNWHPILVHFTIGLFGASALFYLLTLFRSSHGKAFRLAGRLNLWLGMVMTVGTLLTGWYAYNTVPHDGASHEVMTTHRNIALFTALVFAGLTVWSLRQAIFGRREPRVFVLALALATAPLAVTGFYGGELVYRHGVGVLSLPDPDDHHHHGENGHGDNDHPHEHEHEHEHEHDGEERQEEHEHEH